MPFVKSDILNGSIASCARRMILPVCAVLALIGCGGEQAAVKDEAAVDDMVGSAPAQVTEAVEALEKGSAAAKQTCQGGSGFEVYCGFYNPEDLVIVPTGANDLLLVSEMGEFRVHEPTGFALLDLTANERREIDVEWAKPAQQDKWGDMDCPAPDASLFSPHGIDLIQRQDDRHQVLAVNHGGRESVEFFELLAGDAGWSLEWRGCALPPGDPYINDVAGLTDGGFLVTHMWNKSMPFDEVATKLLAGEKTGWVYEWQADTGFVQLPASIENMPNGIAVNADNSKIYINIYIGNKTIRIDRATGEKDGEFAVQQPDNVTVDETGQVWVASHTHDPINQVCTEPGVCLLPFQIVRANPVDLKAEVVLEHSGEPMGYSTVALKVGERVYMGSAHGDRIASYPIK